MRKQMRGISIRPDANAALWLGRFIPTLDRAEKEARAKFIKQASQTLGQSSDFQTFYEAFYHRWEASLKLLGADRWKAEVQGRMIVGLGDESVLETSVALHRVYGVPYIPGSALKGLAASYARNHLDGWKDSQAYKVIFGKTDEAGYINFHDALYVPNSGFEVEVNGRKQKQALHADVITVHHENYYGNQKDAAPADWDDPNPVPFLSATGRYLIALSAPPGLAEECAGWIETAKGILELALEREGIGAKTSSGYGRMKFVDDK